jgi:hypothetical protein
VTTLVTEIQPVELVCSYLRSVIPVGEVPGGIVEGQPNEEQIEAKCISVVEAGQPRPTDIPIIWSMRAQVRCLAPAESEASRLGQIVRYAASKKSRIEATQRDGHTYLLYTLDVTGGPGMHYDSPISFESLLMAEATVSVEPIS